MPTNLKLIGNVLAYELVRRALLTRAILTFFRGTVGQDVEKIIFESAQKKRGNNTLNIVFPRTGLLFDGSFKTNNFWPFSFFEGVTMVYIAIFG